MVQASQFLAVLSSALFAGAAIYINVAEHPARMSCGTELASTVFGPSYKRAAAMQVLLAVVATISGIAAWAFGSGGPWLVGAAVIFGVIPFTLVAIMPTNRALLNPSIDRKAEGTRQLLEKWARLHALRSVMGLVAASWFLWQVLWT